VVLLRRRSGFRVAGWQAQRVFPFEKSFHRDIQRNERSEPKVIGSGAGSFTHREQSGKSKLRLINAG
jgi:hypothetical protein